jgi:hypothetical protein
LSQTAIIVNFLSGKWMSFTPSQGLFAPHYPPFAGFLLQAAFLFYMLASEIRTNNRRKMG